MLRCALFCLFAVSAIAGPVTNPPDRIQGGGGSVVANGSVAINTASNQPLLIYTNSNFLNSGTLEYNSSADITVSGAGIAKVKWDGSLYQVSKNGGTYFDILTSDKLGAASGVATLDGTQKLTASQIPYISIAVYRGSKASQAAMLATSPANPGDWVIRSDLSTTWVVTGTDATQLSSWTQLGYPTAPVTSVNSLTGAVTLQLANTISSTASQFLTSYNATTGNFTKGGVAASDVSGLPTVATTSDILKGDGSGNAVAFGSGSGVTTFLTTPTSANLATAVSDENGSGKLIFAAGTLAITSGKTLTASNTLTLAGTDGSTLNIGAGGTLGTGAYATAFDPTAPGAIGGTTPGTGTFTTLTNSGAATNSKSGAASTAALTLSGVPFAGTGTTSFPLVYINDANATASTTLNTAGTYFGINIDGTQDGINVLKDGTSKFKVDSAGAITTAAGVTTGGTVQINATSGVNFNTNVQLVTGAGDGILALTQGSSVRLRFGSISSNSKPEIQQDAVNGFTLQSAASTSTWNDSSTANSGTVANRYLFGIAAPTLTSTGTSVTNTVASTVYIGGAPTASTNTTIGTAYALNVNAGTTNLGGNVIVGGTLSVTGATALTGTTTNDNAAAGKVGEYVSASVVQGSAVVLTTATPKTVTSISLTAGDWDVTGIGSLTGASTGTEFDVAIGTTTNSFTGTVLGDTRAQTPTVSLTGADATLMIPSVRVSISSTTTYYLIVQETFTVGAPSAYGRISARRVR